MVTRAAQSSRGRMLRMKSGLKGRGVRAREASRKWRGYDDGEDLHVRTAQVRKLVVRSFIFGGG